MEDIEEEIALKNMHREDTSSNKFYRAAKGIKWKMAWDKDLNKMSSSAPEHQESQGRNRSNVFTFNPNSEYLADGSTKSFIHDHTL